MLQQKVGIQKNFFHKAVWSYREVYQSLLSSKLDFHGEKSSYGIHSWHPFPAKFPPQLPQLFIRELTKPGDIVFDPMMGSCTTLIESLVLKRRALGCDIDPLALKLGKAKLQQINLSLCLSVGSQILSNAQTALEERMLELNDDLTKRFDKKTKAFIDYWFTQRTQLELVAILREIELLDNSSLRDFFLLVFSGTIIAKSGGVSLARDLAHTRPHKVNKIPASAFAEFQKRLRRIVENNHHLFEEQFQIFEANAQHLPLQDNCVDLIITSPPYASHAIDYMRAHKFSLVWLGHELDMLSKLRRKYIGADSSNGIKLVPLPKRSQKIVDLLRKVDKKKALSLHRYYSEMTFTLSEMHRVLKPGRAAVVVVGSSIMRGMDVETATCLGEIGQYVGFELIHTALRQLDRDKRMMPTRWHKENRTGIESRMHEEFVIGFLKLEN